MKGGAIMRHLILMMLSTALICGCYNAGSLDGDTGPDTDTDSDTDTDIDTDTDTDSDTSVVLHK